MGVSQPLRSANTTSPTGRLHRTRALRLSILFLLLAAAVGCAKLPSFLTEPAVVIRAMAFDTSRQAYLTERAREFERLNEGIRVEVMPQMGSIRGNVTQAIKTFQTGTTTIDVVAMTDQDFGTITDFDVLIELSAFIRETTDLQPGDFYPTALPAFQHRGRQMMMPTELLPTVVFYNRDLFDAAKAPYPREAGPCRISWSRRRRSRRSRRTASRRSASSPIRCLPRGHSFLLTEAACRIPYLTPRSTPSSRQIRSEGFSGSRTSGCVRR